MTEHTQTHWGLMCRGVCKDWLMEHSTQKGEVSIRSVYQCKTINYSGGVTVDENLNIVPKIVEIDESCFTKSRRSYHPCVTPSFLAVWRH